MGVHKLDSSLARGAVNAPGARAAANPFGVVSDGLAAQSNPFAMATASQPAAAPAAPAKAADVPTRQERVLEFLSLYAYLTHAPWLTPFVDENGNCTDPMTIIGKLNAFDASVHGRDRALRVLQARVRRLVLERRWPGMRQELFLFLAALLGALLWMLAALGH